MAINIAPKGSIPPKLLPPVSLLQVYNVGMAQINTNGVNSKNRVGLFLNLFIIPLIICLIAISSRAVQRVVYYGS